MVAATSMVAMLAACSAPSTAPGAEPVDVAPVAATECGELIDEGVTRATRLASEGIPEDIVDHALAVCGGDPSLSWAEALQWAQDEAAGSSSSAGSISDAARLQQTFSVTDTQGYTFDLAVDAAVYDIEPDPSTQAPGFTAATRSLSLAMTLVNTTPQRELSFEAVRGVTSPFNLPTFLFKAEFDAGSAVCTVAFETDEACSWALGFGRMESGTTVAPGSEYTLTVWSGVPNGGDESEMLPRIPEDSWADVLAALSQPAGFSIDYSAADPHRFESVCEPGDSMFSSLDAMLPTLVSTVPC